MMHNGSEPYEGVLQTVQELKNAGKKMIVLSNSSKRRENSERMLVKRELCCTRLHVIDLASFLALTTASFHRTQLDSTHLTSRTS